MSFQAVDRPYQRVQDLLKSVDPSGEMKWRSGGAGGGGTWYLELHDRTVEVRVQDNHVNALDGLYVAKVGVPSTWDDFTEELRPDGFWRLVALFPEAPATSVP